MKNNEFSFDGEITKKLNEIKNYYDKTIQNLENNARESNQSYGGYIRAQKGKLVEYMAKELVKIAWENVLKQSLDRIKMNSNKMNVSISDRYGFIKNIEDNEVKSYLNTNRDKQIYKFGTDVHVFVDGEMALPIECKSYTENAMLKRILFDAELMKEVQGCKTYYLFQLESQLGGDYSKLNNVSMGSPATNALLSHVDVKIEIITLLRGERNINEPIHDSRFPKELNIEQLKKAVTIFAKGLKDYR